MDIYLKNCSGLDIVFKCNSNIIEFEGRKIKPEIRKSMDMIEVAYDKKWVDECNPEKPMYLMFRDICNKGDKEIIEGKKLRYDITIILPYMMGAEYPKTKGHYHSNAEQSEVSYPEIYEVLHGEGHYIMQKINKKGDVVDVYMVKAKTGDKIIIPPGYGHITINPANDILIMANWVGRDSKSDYGPILKKGGAVYFEIKEKDKNKIIVNEKYGDAPNLRIVKPILPKLIRLEAENPMYKLVNNIEALDFLIHPQDHENLFRTVF